MNAIYRMPDAGAIKRQPYRTIHFAGVNAHRKYAPSKNDFVQRFFRHLARWHSETTFTSSLDEILSHPSYQAIVALGEPAKDLLIYQLRRVPGLEVYALEDICGYSPYGQEIFGNIEAMTDAWIAEAENW